MRPALDRADRTRDRTERRRANDDLAARLAGIARARGREPVPRPGGDIALIVPADPDPREGAPWARAL